MPRWHQNDAQISLLPVLKWQSSLHKNAGKPQSGFIWNFLKAKLGLDDHKSKIFIGSLNLDTMYSNKYCLLFLVFFSFKYTFLSYYGG